jgi:hypothetical protein
VRPVGGRRQKLKTEALRIMAIYHLQAKIISRADGQDVVASAAYRSGDKIESERYGKIHDYTHKSGVIKSEIIAPDNAPDWIFDRAKLWNEIERIEKRKDSQLAREFEISIPRELDIGNQECLVKTFVNDSFVSLGMVADVSYHDKGDGNPHAHILLSTRKISQNGFGGKAREWNDKELFQTWRESWEKAANEALRIAGHDIQIDCRTLEAQGIDRIPQIHVGAVANAMPDSWKKSRNEEIKRLNSERQKVIEELAEIEAEETRLRLEVEARAAEVQKANEEARKAEEYELRYPRLLRAAQGKRIAETLPEIPGIEFRFFAKTNENHCIRQQTREVLFAEKENQIRIWKPEDDEALTIALRLAEKKWGGVKISGGDEKFRERCVVLAVENGIKISNPELAELAESIVKQHLKDKGEAKAGERHRQMGDVNSELQAAVAEKAEVPSVVPPRVAVTSIGATVTATPTLRSSVLDEAAAAAKVTLPKPEIEGATVAPISGKMASSTSKPSKAPEPGVAIEVPAPALRATLEEQRDGRTQRATPTGVEVARISLTPKPGEAPKPGAAVEVPAPKVDVQEQMVAASRELKDRILKDETPKPRVAAEVPSPTSSVTPEAQRDVRTQQATPPISNEAAAAAKIAEGIKRAKARFAERQTREAEEKRRQEAEIDRQRKERQALEERAREEELKRKQEEERQKHRDLEEKLKRKREEERQKRRDLDREGGWSR